VWHEHNKDHKNMLKKGMWLWNIAVFALFCLVSGAHAAAIGPSVRVVYLVPSDKAERPEYTAAIKNAMRSIQDFYRQQGTDGKTFQIDDRMVEVYKTPHTAAWYAVNNASALSPFVVWWNANNDAVSLIPGFRTDGNTDWVVYVDADYPCWQNEPQHGGAGLPGIAIMPAPDLRGLAGETPNLECLGATPPQISSFQQNRWIGGLAHEFGHSLGLPHSPGCEKNLPTCDYNALMWTGLYDYPNTHLSVDEMAILAANAPHVSFMSLKPISDAIFDYYELSQSSWYPSHQPSTLTAADWYQRIYSSTNRAMTVRNISSSTPSLYRTQGQTNTPMGNPTTVFNNSVKMINAAELISSSSGKCADTNFGGTANGTPVIQYDCGGHDTPNMRWKLQPVASSGAFQLINKRSGTCLRPLGGASYTSNVEISTCSTSQSMQWDVVPIDAGRYQLRNRASGMCLTSPGPNDWLTLSQTPCDTSNAKRWQIMR
jgi:hypothetical protein